MPVFLQHTAIKQNCFAVLAAVLLLVQGIACGPADLLHEYPASCAVSASTGANGTLFTKAAVFSWEKVGKAALPQPAKGQTTFFTPVFFRDAQSTPGPLFSHRASFEEVVLPPNVTLRGMLPPILAPPFSL